MMANTTNFRAPGFLLFPTADRTSSTCPLARRSFHFMSLQEAIELVQLVADSLYYQGNISEEQRNIDPDDKYEIALAIVERFKRE